MIIELIAGGVIVVGLVAYLVYVLFNPSTF
ncbi:potassium-transporting ATPase subunit F [Alkalilimnicola ehrlichii]|uniref:Potassium-transporting ATPase subunit F n=1 Tax=Alkalilimnicola ehrlichii TaxID=351052 RepID=A0A3E0WXI8_9GAMM|nr:K(+)-transporting ATPase subunit F [Alkalilimnicola ehrlichii]RFA30169.1 potassium-transporting ATPase subunit F [Alkalilimnicola ehrlichii]RFA37518.1 potassium-transporting ATPase subunit F [Alkalilimnicola ehrlichii]